MTSDFAGALAAALATVAADLGSCQCSILPPPAGQQIDPSALNGYVVARRRGPPAPAALVRRDVRPGCFLDDARTRAVLCPRTCALLRSDPQARVEIKSGCASQPVTR
jgi:hypothetical protein